MFHLGTRYLKLLSGHFLAKSTTYLSDAVSKNAYFQLYCHSKFLCETPCITEMLLRSCGTATLTNSYESVFYVSYNEDPSFLYYETRAKLWLG